MDLKKVIKLAFIGTGSWAKRYHLPSLDYIRAHPTESYSLQLHGIYGLKHEEAVELAKQYSFGKVYDSLEQLIADNDVDAVALVITPEAVKDVLLKVLAKNVPVFTEKPPGATYDEAQELARAVHVANVVGYNRRYNKLNNKFKSLVEKTKNISKVRGLMYRINRREPHFVIQTGGHLVNFMEYLFGPIVKLQNEKYPYPATGEKAHLAHLTFGSGLSGELLFVPCSDRHWEGVEVYASGQKIVIHSPHESRPGEITIYRNDETQGEIVAQSGPAGANDAIPILEEGYAFEHMDFLSAIIKGNNTRSNFANAVNTIRVAEAIENNKDISC